MNSKTKFEENMEVVHKKEEKNTELISRKEVEGTPFMIISKNDVNEHFAVLGEYRITEVYDDVKMVDKEVKKVTWNRIIQVIMIMNEKNINLKDK